MGFDSYKQRLSGEVMMADQLLLMMRAITQNSYLSGSHIYNKEENNVNSYDCSL
jgi:hypothetical protein